MNRRLGALCLALTAAIIASISVGARQAAAPQNPPPASPAAAGRGGRGAPPIKSPEIGADHRVTFRFRAPNAKEVVVAVGGKRLTMQKDDQGVWSATTDALSPDIYTYSLIVDGATVGDPVNRQVQTSFGSFQPMFVVPGSAPWLPAPGVPRGAIARHVFHSAVANDDRDFFVYLPPGYDARRAQPYPVFYLLHGLGDDAERWVNAGAANVILDNLIAEHKAVPMVMVTPLGYGFANGPEGARGDGGGNTVNYTRILLDEVMPIVDKTYNVSRDRNDRAIAGLSMGGAEATYAGLNHLDKFAWIASFSGAYTMWPGATTVPAPVRDAAAPAPPAAAGGRATAAPMQMLEASTFAKVFPSLDAKANSQIRLFWIVCGTADGLLGMNRQFKEWLKSKYVQFTEQEVPDLGHVWPLWRQNVADLAPRLFQPKTKP
jgi:enterochelin esterase family protein